MRFPLSDQVFGIDGPKISRANLLSQHSHFGLTREQAETILDDVAEWAQELKDHYGQFLRGEELKLAQEATTSRMFSGR